MPKAPPLPLSSSQKQLRLLGLAAIFAFLTYAWLLNPESAHSYWNWNLSGFRNLTGLPCPLCGGTRATHYLMQGNISKVLYYNWLAIPALLISLSLVILFSLELLQKRTYLPALPHLSPTLLILSLLGLTAIWLQHVQSALNHPKPELLNTQGLYFKLNP
jgi:hypothetical protein